MKPGDSITIVIGPARDFIEGTPRRNIRMEHWSGGKMSAVYEQPFPVNDGDVARADSLALRRFAQLVRGLLAEETGQ